MKEVQIEKSKLLVKRYCLRNNTFLVVFKKLEILMFALPNINFSNVNQTC
jgi:hypothetical protein